MHAAKPTSSAPERPAHTASGLNALAVATRKACRGHRPYWILDEPEEAKVADVEVLTATCPECGMPASFVVTRHRAWGGEVVRSVVTRFACHNGCRPDEAELQKLAG